MISRRMNSVGVLLALLALAASEQPVAANDPLGLTGMLTGIQSSVGSLLGGGAGGPGGLGGAGSLVGGVMAPVGNIVNSATSMVNGITGPLLGQSGLTNMLSNTLGGLGTLTGGEGGLVGNTMRLTTGAMNGVTSGMNNGLGGVAQATSLNNLAQSAVGQQMISQGQFIRNQYKRQAIPDSGTMAEAASRSSGNLLANQMISGTANQVGNFAVGAVDALANSQGGIGLNSAGARVGANGFANNLVNNRAFAAGLGGAPGFSNTAGALNAAGAANAASAYHAANAYQAANAYHAANAYQAANAYNAANTVGAAGALGAASALGAANALNSAGAYNAGAYNAARSLGAAGASASAGALEAAGAAVAAGAAQGAQAAAGQADSSVALAVPAAASLPNRQALALSALGSAQAESAVAGADMVAQGANNARSASLASNAYREAKLAKAHDRVNIAGTIQNSARISDAAIATHDAATVAEDSLLGSELAVDSASTVLDSDAAYIPPVTNSLLRSLPYGRLGLRNIIPKPLTYPSVMLPDVWLNGVPVNYYDVPLRLLPYGLRPVAPLTANGQPIVSNNGMILSTYVVDPAYAYASLLNGNLNGLVGTSLAPILANGQLEAQDEVAIANSVKLQQLNGLGMANTYQGYERINPVPLITGSVSEANLMPTTTIGTTYPIGSALVIEPRDSYFQDNTDNASSRQNFDERQQ